MGEGHSKSRFIENAGYLPSTLMRFPRSTKDVIDLLNEDDDNDQVIKVKTSETILSEKPKASIIHNFLSKKECEHLIALSKPYLRRSLVGGGGGPGQVSSSRTSYGTFLSIGEDCIVLDIERRIADYTKVPIENGEKLQVLRYEVGQKFEPHFDYSDDSSYISTQGPRMATVLMYLSDVEEGGETVFPKAERKITSDSCMAEREIGISVKPKDGGCISFLEHEA